MRRLSALSLAALVLLTAGPVAASAPAPTAASARFEVRFMTEMIDHHQMAIEMAEACLDRAAQPDLIGTCAEIIAAQAAEQDQMQTWLADWYDVTYEPRMTAGQLHQVEKLMALQGPAFDIEFMESMIGHHWLAVVRAERCLDLAVHDPLLATCGNIVETQSAEIATMQTWLCAWYDRCRYREGQDRG